MSLFQSFKLAIDSLLVNKVRSLLTMLGIIIGVAAVIIIVSLGNGMTLYIQDMFSTFGTNLITVYPAGWDSSRNVTDEDIFRLGEDHPGIIAAAMPVVTTAPTVKYGTDSISTTGYGVGEGYNEIKNTKVSKGRFLQYIDIARRQNVCVVGSYIEKELYAGDSLGKELIIDGYPHRIVGVMEEKAASEKSSTDDVVLMPYTTTRKLSAVPLVTAYYFSAVDEKAVPRAKTIISNTLYKIYQDENAYTIISMTEMLDSVNSMMATMVLFLSAIAAISLLVGGIGIMNIMLVSVSERTREIGIRKSLGAKRRDIMSQFVIEAATTSVIGGIIGIGIGVLVADLVGDKIDVTASPSFSSILMAVGVSIAIGVVFGLLPASKAAKMNPIDALRFD